MCIKHTSHNLPQQVMDERASLTHVIQMLEAPAPSHPQPYRFGPIGFAQPILLSKGFYTLCTYLVFVFPTCVISDKDPVLFPSDFLDQRCLM